MAHYIGFNFKHLKKKIMNKNTDLGLLILRIAVGLNVTSRNC
jgi:hypothetical protein